MLMSGIISGLISLIIIVTGHYLMGLFTDDAGIIETGTRYLMIVSSFYVIFSIMFSFAGVFRGAGDTLFPMLITLLSLWLIRVPLSEFLSDHYNETGIWVALPITWTFGMLASMIYFFTGRWKNKVVVKPQIVSE
jgi:Na+-driven multidrug efflux pump